jgi:membrane-bound metal-dependent hydrolase YbcI (DUF457 family)
MFAGHLAVALGAKRAAPRVPLGMLVGASFGLDLLWPLLLLAGIEHVRIDPGNTAMTPLAFDHYPWSHSLAMALVWGIVLGIVVFVRRRTASTGVLVGAVVVSHWLLDFVVHRPDLPLWPGGPEVGLGLWHSVPGTLLVEGALLVAGIELYRRAFPPRSGTGRWAFWGLVGLIGVIWVSSPWSPPPPNDTAVAIVGLAMWLFPAWAAWIERHRHTRAV